jgi:hypothetical protein
MFTSHPYIKEMTLISQAFRSERASWRAVIHLNVVRSIHLILDAITRAQNNVNPTASRDSLKAPSTVNPDLLKLKLRLAPLLQAERILIGHLTPAGSGESEATRLLGSKGLKELAVNSTTQWKGAFTRLITGEKNNDASGDDEQAFDPTNPNDPGTILNSCAEDMISLWSNPAVHELLAKQSIRLKDLAGL